MWRLFDIFDLFLSPWIRIRKTPESGSGSETLCCSRIVEYGFDFDAKICAKQNYTGLFENTLWMRFIRKSGAVKTITTLLAQN